LLARWPTLLFLAVLAALAVQPTILFGRQGVFYEWGLQHALVGLALIAIAITHGLRPTVNWPILALAGVLALNLAFGTHPDLTLGFMLFSLFILALPWSFTQVVMPPEARRAASAVIALAPLLSLAAAGVLQAAGMLRAHPVRLQGAAGDPAIFATLAFAGFAVALHEATRPGRSWLALLAVVDLALVILSGTRMAILASCLFAAVYGLSSAEFRRWLRAHKVVVVAAGCVVLAVVVWYSPVLVHRLTRHGHFRWSGRDVLWQRYVDDFLASPMFGRGLGAGFVTTGELPHNEYLHLLVIGGWVGFALCLAAIVLWLRQLLQAVAAGDRAFVTATIPAVAAYWLTDNLLVYSTGLALYAYLGLLLTKPSRPTRRRTRRNS
jgi:O-antigen ligase